MTQGQSLREMPDLTAVAARLAASPAQVFGDFFLSRLMGLEITPHADKCHVRFTVRPELTNPAGTLHGGMMATALDVSMGHLIYFTEGAPAATLEMKVQYLAPAAVGAQVLCVAHFTKRGRSVNFLAAEAVEAVSGTRLALASATWTGALKPLDPARKAAL